LSYFFVMVAPRIWIDSFYPILGSPCLLFSLAAIAPNYRGKGVATTLLTHVCKDAMVTGFNVIEGYPQLRNQRETFDFVGPARLFEKVGFVKVAEQDNIAIMRTVL
ncbi:MAG: GNAT family N-acetyltransferase, partial [Paenibacillus sp.]|uniref:GNAT family N-acetyltransferase n=1 Tax=Paenibacillus sp. TaxID=58172 RepID=UPI002903FE13